ncbi:MAG TPA: DUF3943 domain-containing protein [Anaeromyxobacteraceae bacterium]|nr:DUF3943 domain-containing protein [Anaeromyxobacteraceae bacterium]
MALLAVSSAHSARAEEPAPEAEPFTEEIPTFSYMDPQPGSRRLRASLELLAMQAVAFTGYLVVNPRASIPGMQGSVPPWDKLMLRSGTWSFEADAIYHNYFGHPVASTIYYLTARGNRLPVLESSLWTGASALAWELAEYNEPVSVNDMMTTTFSGIAIGEAFMQLATWAERSGNGGVLTWLAFPKKVHDSIDGARPAQLDDPGWHEFRAFVGAGSLWQGEVRPAIQASVSTRLFRLPGFGAPGNGGASLTDGEQSRLGLSLTYAGGGGLADARFRAETSLWGIYRRDIALDTGEGRRGTDLFFGAGIGFDYQYHEERRLESPWFDQMILLEVPGAELDFRTFAGAFALATRASAAFTFGGVRPVAFEATAPLPPAAGVPSVMSSQGYYHSAGYALGLDVRLDLGPASLSAGVAYNDCWAIQELDGIPPGARRVEISDTRLETGARASYRVADSGVEIQARWDRRVRSGQVGPSERSTSDTLGVLGAAFVF